MLLDNAVEIIAPFWDVAALGVTGLGAVAFKTRDRRRPTAKWEVQITPAEKLVDVRYEDRWGDSITQINRNDAIVVRLKRAGQVLELGTVSAKSDDVEEQIDSLVAKAQEKAYSLNARM